MFGKIWSIVRPLARKEIWKELQREESSFKQINKLIQMVIKKCICLLFFMSAALL